MLKFIFDRQATMIIKAPINPLQFFLSVSLVAILFLSTTYKHNILFRFLLCIYETKFHNSDDFLSTLYFPSCLTINFRRICNNAGSEYYFRHVCQSVRLSVTTEELGYHWKNFHEERYLRIFRKSVEKLQLPRKSE